MESCSRSSSHKGRQASRLSDGMTCTFVILHFQGYPFYSPETLNIMPSR